MEHRGVGAVVFPLAAARRVLAGAHRRALAERRRRRRGHRGRRRLRDPALVAARRRACPSSASRPSTSPSSPRARAWQSCVNPNSGSENVDPTDEILAMWPKAEIVRIEQGVDVVALLEERIGDYRALGAAGGDGTVTCVADVAVRHDLPLVVVPAGTLDHFARDLGVEGLVDTADATQVGSAIRVDVAEVRVDDGAGRCRAPAVHQHREPRRLPGDGAAAGEARGEPAQVARRGARHDPGAAPRPAHADPARRLPQGRLDVVRGQRFLRAQGLRRGPPPDDGLRQARRPLPARGPPVLAGPVRPRRAHRHAADQPRLQALRGAPRPTSACSTAGAASPPTARSARSATASRSAPAPRALTVYRVVPPS